MNNGRRKNHKPIVTCSGYRGNVKAGRVRGGVRNKITEQRKNGGKGREGGKKHEEKPAKWVGTYCISDGLHEGLKGQPVW